MIDAHTKRKTPLLLVPITTQDEQRLLSLAAEVPDVAAVLLEQLRSGDFYAEHHPAIFTAMRLLAKDGQAINIVSLQLKLRERLHDESARYVVDQLNGINLVAPNSDEVAAWIKALQARRKAAEAQEAQQQALRAVESGDPEQMKAALKLIENDQSATQAGYKPYSVPDLDHIPPVRWLYGYEIPEGGLSMLVGPSEGGKSFLMVDRAISTAFAHPDRAVVYIAPEGGSGYRQRIAAWVKHYNRPAPANLFFILEAVQFLDVENITRFIRSVSQLNPILVIVDTLARAMIGGEENSAKDMGLFIAACDRIRHETGSAVHVVHHSGKSGNGYRGSSALFAACDAVTELSNDDGLICISCAKSKDSAHFESQYMRLLPVAESCVIVSADKVIQRGAALTQRQKQVLEALAMEVFRLPGAKAADLIDILGIPRKSLYRTFDVLIRDGYVGQAAKGDPYHITAKGRNAVSLCHDTANDTPFSDTDTATRSSFDGIGSDWQTWDVSPDEPQQDAEVSLVSDVCHEVSDTPSVKVSHVSHPFRGDTDTTLTQDETSDISLDELFPETPDLSVLRASGYRWVGLGGEWYFYPPTNETHGPYADKDEAIDMAWEHYREAASQEAHEQ